MIVGIVYSDCRATERGTDRQTNKLSNSNARSYVPKGEQPVTHYPTKRRANGLAVLGPERSLRRRALLVNICLSFLFFNRWRCNFVVRSSCLDYSLELSFRFYSLSARDFADCEHNELMQANAGALIPAPRRESRSSDRRVEMPGNINGNDR